MVLGGPGGREVLLIEKPSTRGINKDLLLFVEIT